MKILIYIVIIISLFQVVYSQSITTQPVQIISGWNLLSLPLSTNDSLKNLLFPSAISSAFIFDNSYQIKDTLHNGPGFWLKFGASETLFISGKAVFNDTIPVRSGWNMVGSLSLPVFLDSIKTEPADIIVSAFYNYPTGSGYQSAAIIQPGYGYWVKVKEDGVLYLSTSVKSCPGEATVDYAGKTYNTVQIGSQCWLKEYLDIGSMVDSLADQTDNNIIEKYCYGNDPAMCDTFGGLYQWNEAMDYFTVAGSKGLCPHGWHIPTSDEYNDLYSHVGSKSNPLLEIGQGSGIGAGTNTSGFSALLAGCRTKDAYFSEKGLWTYLWRSDDADGYHWAFIFYAPIDYTNFWTYEATYGMSIRCIKDSVENTQPSVPLYLQPENNSVGRPPIDTLRWSCTDPDGDPLKYDVYFGTDNHPLTIFSSNRSDTSLIVSGSMSGTTYYWKIVAEDSHGDSTEGPVWDFTTMGAVCPGIPTVYYEGKTYNTIQIGPQCWLKENLDVGTRIDGGIFQADNSVLEKYCYNNDPARCDTFGGLYQWNEAMQYSTTEGARGICPEGWHIPTYSEFQTLSAVVGGDGNALKAIGQGAGAGAGTNTSGFSALLGGFSNDYGDFTDKEVSAFFWSSKEGNAMGAHRLDLYNSDGNVALNGSAKVSGLIIRCIKDSGEAPQIPELSSPSNGAESIPVLPTLIWKTTQDATSYSLQVSTDSLFDSYAYNQSGLTDTSQQITELTNTTLYYWRVSATNSYSTSNWSSKWSFTTSAPCPGTPTVDHEGKTYHTVQIGSQCWLKENMDIGTMVNGIENQSNNDTIQKYCYDNEPSKCDTFGGLYQWNEAMQYTTTPGARGICPAGWHIPTYAEFQTCSTTVGGDGNALKAIGQGTGAGAGTNTSGFSVLLGGISTTIPGDFNGLGVHTHFWGSTTEYPSQYGVTIDLRDDTSAINLHFDHKGYGFSVRCIKD